MGRKEVNLIGKIAVPCTEEPSLAQVSMDRLKDMGQGFADIGFVGNYLVRPDEQGDPSFVSPTDVMSDVVGLGSGMASAIAEDPLGSLLDVIPGVSPTTVL